MHTLSTSALSCNHTTRDELKVPLENKENEK